MPEYDPVRDDDTKIISVASLAKAKEADAVVLPDGTRPVKMGSGVITGILGEGGMSVIYEIWNEQLGVKRAVKLLRPNSSKESRVRFEQEMKVTAQLDHPNIIDIHAVGEWNGLPYIEMEKVHGLSLEELIARQGALPVPVCTAIGIIMCRALDYTHHHNYTIDTKPLCGLLHRDLKPANILVSREGVARLTDFGVATPPNASPNASAGTVIGSMQYLAPEQLEEKDTDARADIFSFGVIFYEMVTGQKMFPERNLTKLIKKRLANEFVPLSAADVALPEELIRCINQCLELHVNKRPQDVRDVMGKLEKIHAGISSRSPEETIQLFVKGETFEEIETYSTKGSRARKISAAALITVCSALIVVFFFALFSRPSKRAANKMPAAAAKNPAPAISAQPAKTEAASVPAPAVEETAVVAAAEIPPEPPKVVVKKKTVRPPAVATGRTPVLTKNARKKEVAAGKASGIVEELYKKYNTADYLFILQQEDEAKNYATVLEVFQALAPSQTGSIEARLFRHRALAGTRKADNAYYENYHINDGEFFLSKAKFLYERKQYQRALWMLGSIESAPVALLDKKTVERDGLYYRAKCNTALFYAAPSEEKQKTAMQSWFDVKSEFRANQTHPYFIEANNEIREINKQLNQ